MPSTMKPRPDVPHDGAGEGQSAALFAGRLICPSDMWPVTTPAIEPSSGMNNRPTSDETSETIARVFVLAGA